MKSHIGMRYLILQIAWLTLGGCWPMLGAEHEFDLKIARDSQPVGSSTTNSTALTLRTITLRKKVNGSLALFIFLLVVVTYWFLMRYTTKLSSEIALPSKFLEKNVAAVLSQTWQRNITGSTKDVFKLSSISWALFCIKSSSEIPLFPNEYLLPRPFSRALGFCDLKEKLYLDYEPEKSFIVLVKAFSPVMKSLVQIAIWNSVSSWLVLVMFINTLVYNGFLTKNVINDSIIRLIFVGVYAVANLGYRYHTTTLLYRSFTCVLFQTCWTIICRQFVFLNYSLYRLVAMEHIGNGKYRYRDHLSKDASQLCWTTFNFELFGATERSKTYQILGDIDQRRYDNTRVGSIDDASERLSDNDKRLESYLRARDETEGKFDNFVKPLLEAEIKTYEKAADSVLEKALANVAVLLGICLATALAPWTSQTINATSVQLGSYALLLSISTGLLALVSGITQLTNATESARRVLLLQEKTIERGLEHENATQHSRLDEEPMFSFSGKDIDKQSPLTAFGLWKSMSLLHKFFGLLFGSALMLIPRIHGKSKRWTYITVEVEGRSFDCGTVDSYFVKTGRGRESDKEKNDTTVD